MNCKKIVAVTAATICAGATLGVVGSSNAGAQELAPQPVSYINPDTGAATVNPDVDPASGCTTPDQSDTQTVGDEATGAGNVHNDACLLDAQGADVDAQVAFQSTGVGIISGCPDPDGAAGPKTAANTVNKTLCVQSGFETGGANGTAGDGEYHARLVSATPGTQTVTFCADPEGDGCANATVTSVITVTWVARPVSYINPDTGAATVNPDVDPASGCTTPDQSDTQTVGDEATGAGNVHNDACLLDGLGADVDAQVAFQSSGVGIISGCPDPDGAAGPKTAANTVNKTLCVQSGFETGGANGTAGDGEYHVRLVSATPGTQTVTFCADPEGDGCANATVTSVITVTWAAAAVVPTTTMPPTTTTALPLPPPVTLPSTGLSTASQSLVGLAFILAGGSLVLAVRRRRPA